MQNGMSGIPDGTSGILKTMHKKLKEMQVAGNRDVIQCLPASKLCFQYTVLVAHFTALSEIVNAGAGEIY
jgi:hypothetical protein